MENLGKRLKGFRANKDIIEWVGERSWVEVYNKCERGDWLLWLYTKTMKSDEESLRLLVLAKGHCVYTIAHLMKDKRSIAAIYAAISFGEGKISKKELKIAAKDARNAAWDATYFATDSDSITAAYAAAGAFAASYTGSNSAGSYAAAATYAAGKTYENLKQTADIVRKYIPIEKFNL